MEDEISNKIIGAAIEVHRILGPGLLESIYESSLCHELKLRGLSFKTQIIVPIEYKGVSLKDSLILDIIVENKVIIEVKSTEKDHSSHKAQLLTYLKMTGLKLGLVINFGHSFLKDGIHRIVNQL